MKQILGFLVPYKKRMALGLMVKISATVVELLIPWALAVMIDTIVPMGSVLYIILWGLLMLVFAVCAFLFNVKANRMASLVARNTTERIRLELFSKINYMSMKEQNEATAASLISRATSDTYNVHQFLGMMQRLGVRQPVMLLGSLTITFFLDVPLSLVMLSMMPVMALLVYLFTHYGVPMFGKVQAALDRFVRVVREDIAGIRVIKALSKTDTERERFEEINMDVVERDRKAGTVMGGMHPVVNIILNIGMILVIYAGAKRVDNGLAKPGTILAFMTYVTTCLNAILFMSRLFLMFSRANASAKRITEVLNTKNDMEVLTETESAETIRERAEKGRIIFENVSFGYNEGHHIVKNIGFTLKAGQTLGIIGATGSGKSTLIRLLMRFYDTSEGRIYIDGKDIRTYEEEELKAKFGAVFQNDIIFRDTIRENVSFSRPLQEEDIVKALKTAQADFAFERGLDYELAIKGANISGGQKQRIYIARALAADPEILVLDDSSSALDYATDAALRDAIAENYEGITKVVVAQRVSAVMDADHILVLENGQLIGAGTHEELINSCDVYREIAETQMGQGRLNETSRKSQKVYAERNHKTDILHDTESYKEILREVEENQELTARKNTYKDCMDIAKAQKSKETKAVQNMNKRHTFRRLFSYLMKQKLLILFAIVVTIAANALGLLGPKLSGYAVDAVSFGAGKVDFLAVYRNCLLMLVVYVVSSALSYGLTLIMLQITKRIVSGMRREVFDKLLHMNVSYFDTHAAGDIISKITYDIDTINTSLSGDVVTLVSSLVTVIGSLIMMITISPIMVSVFAITVPVMLLMTKWVTGITRPLFRARSGKLGEMNGFVEEMIGGQQSLKAYHRQIPTIRKFQKQNEKAVDAYYHADYMSAINGPLVNAVSNIAQALLTILGAILFFLGKISLGNISSFMLYSRKFGGPINESANIMAELQSAFAAAERVFRLLDEPVEEPACDPEKILEEVYGNVELHHVDFSYSPDKEILHDLSLKAEQGKVIAIVGPTGAGKTTIINLLMRFYEINKGEILVDGTETREFTRDSLRRAFAMVLQETWLFQGTVFENVAYGNENATLEDVIEVCKAARIHNYIMSLPDQYNTLITGDGTNISKGQKQLLTIARAMLLNAHMLILDEATSNVDTRTESKLQEAMLKLMDGKTCFIIAHRLSTIRNADCILVIKDGRVAEQGTHDELIAAMGIYKDLYEAQWSKGESI